MKISALQKTYNPKNLNSRASTSFGANPFKVARTSTRNIADSGEGLVKLLSKLGRNNGEILNTLVTAFGTALVAPIFIAFNPFSKEDKETTLYSALRQPISAVIAVVSQIAVNAKFNSWLDNRASTGKFEAANLKAKPQESYLKKRLKYTNPELFEPDETTKNEKKSFIKDFFDKRSEQKEKLTKEVDEIQDKAFWTEVDAQRDKLKQGKNEIDYKELIDSHSYKKAKSQLEKEYGKKLLDNLPENEKAALNALDKDAKEAAEKKLTKLTDKQKDKLFPASKVKPLELEMLKADMEKEAKVKFRASKLKEKNPNKSINEVVDELNKKMERINDRAQKSTGKMKAVAEKAAAEQKAVIDKLKTAKDFTDVKDAGKTFKEALQHVKIKRLVKTTINNSEDMLKATKKWGGIFISLATLPFSCGLLNWSYPRIMEKIMPQVANKKKAKEAK